MEDNKKNNDVVERKAAEMDRQAEQMDDLMSQIQGPGYTAALFRISPVWCEGFLEEIEVEPDSGFDMNYIIRKWGGKMINVKLRDNQGKFKRQATLKLKSFAPKENGILLDQFDGMGQTHEKIHGGRVRNPVPVAAPPIQPVQHSQAQFDPNKMMELMLGMFKDMQKQVAKQQTSNQGGLLDGPRSIPDDPFGQLMAGLKTFKEMQKVFGMGDQVINEPKADGDESNLFGGIMQMLGMMMNRQQQPPALPQQAPAAQVVPRPPVVQNDVAQPRPPIPAQPAQQQPNDLPGALASLSPSQIGDILISAASRMDPEKRENAFAEVATRLGGLDGVEYEDDDISSDELDDVDESSNPSPDDHTD